MSESDKPWEDEYVLRKLYVEQDMTMEEVGNVLGCSYNPVYENLKKHGIRRQDPVHHRINSNGYEVWEVTSGGKQYTVPVHRLLAISEYGLDAVAQNHTHHKNRIRWDNRPENIEVKKPSQHTREHREKYTVNQKLGLIEMYENTNSKLKTIASELGIKESAASSIVARFNQMGDSS